MFKSSAYTRTLLNVLGIYKYSFLGKKPSIDTSTCSCRNKRDCPLNEQCQIGDVVYKSTLTSNQQNYKDKKYFRIAKESLKGRLYNHNLFFRNEFHKNDTELSKGLCQIKMKNYTPKITWKIIRKCPPYYLCLNEKLKIALYEGENLLYKKKDHISKCRHQNKFMLLRHDSED